MIISDIMMPEIDGFEFARTVRQVNKSIPILFMSAKDDLPSKQKGFQLGIDGYMVKPIELGELLLRVRALLRRANIEMERKITVGNLVLDADGMSAEIDGEEVPLTTREFNIIYKLLSYPKKTFSRAQLMDEFWGIDSDTSLRAVDVYVTKLRDGLLADLVIFLLYHLFLRRVMDYYMIHIVQFLHIQAGVPVPVWGGLMILNLIIAVIAVLLPARKLIHESVVSELT